jgi:hypothetical protein
MLAKIIEHHLHRGIAQVQYALLAFENVLVFNLETAVDALEIP